MTTASTKSPDDKQGDEKQSDSKSGDGRHYEFQAEVARLLDLMVHSVYSEREVFLRELISNSADALDKLRYEALTDDSLMGADEELAITLAVDSDAKTLTVIDNGVGMDKQELIDNLGTIARSGTKAFIEQVKGQKDKTSGGPDLIGQFGVGFYASFMVADRVEVISRRAGADEAWRWTSDGKGAFDIEAADDAERGARIVLHLKDDALNFLEENELRHIVHTYSDHISFPIFLAAPAPKDTKQEEAEDAEENEKTETIEDAKQQLNEANALWTRPKNDISAEQYKEFYHHIGGMFDEPALTLHYTAEGRQLYTALLFAPTMPPFDMNDAKRQGHVRLYVKRVFITDDAELLPGYLRFVRGVIDSEDIPLNLSREMLQNNPLLAAIRKGVTNKFLGELVKCAEDDADKYIKIWNSFGAVMKEGLYEDAARRDTLYKLARFKTTKSLQAVTDQEDGENKDVWRSLAEYVADMPEKQDAIYYLTGDSLEQLQASPQLEGYLARGLEVLLLTDPVDAFWVTTAAGYEGKQLRSITQGDASLDDIPLTDKPDEEADKAKEETPLADALIDRLKTVLADEVMDVKASTRLVDSPACLIAPAHAPDRQMEKLMAAQQGGGMGALKPILEINPRHPLARALNKAIEDKASEKFDDLSFILFDEARILEGGAPANPAKFAERLNRLILG